MKQRGTDWHHLDFDNEIVGKSFDTLRHPRCSIGPPFDQWEHLKSMHDVARLFRLHHRDWFLRAGLPRQFIADGCLYLKREHRKEACEGLTKVPGYDWHFAFIWLWPLAFEERLRRYKQTTSERHPERTQWDEDTWRASFRHHSQVTADHFEEPNPAEGLTSVLAQNEREVMEFLASWLENPAYKHAREIPVELVQHDHHRQ